MSLLFSFQNFGKISVIIKSNLVNCNCRTQMQQMIMIEQLAHFSPMFHFNILFGFLTFSGGIDIEHWAKMG